MGGHQPVHESNKSIQHGIDNEDRAIEKYVRTYYESNGIECGYIPIGFVKHPTFSYMGASPDALLLFKDRPRSSWKSNVHTKFTNRKENLIVPI